MTYASALTDIDCCESSIAIQGGHSAFSWHPSHLYPRTVRFEQPFVTASYSLVVQYFATKQKEAIVVLASFLFWRFSATITSFKLSSVITEIKYSLIIQ